VNESFEPPNPPADPPKPSKGFTGKPPKKGHLSQKKGSRRKQDESPQKVAGDHASVNLPPPEVDGDVGGEPAPPAVASSSSSLRSQIESRGAKRKALATENESELKRVYAELDASKASLEFKESENSALKKRNKTLTSQLATASDAVRASRSAAREAGSTARATTKEAESEVDKLSRLLENAEAELVLMKKELETKDAALKEQSDSYKMTIEAKEKAKIRVLSFHITSTLLFQM
jgi:hypothetical protein